MKANERWSIFLNKFIFWTHSDDKQMCHFMFDLIQREVWLEEVIYFILINNLDILIWWINTNKEPPQYMV